MARPEPFENARRFFVEPLASFLDPEDRVFLPFLASSALIVVMVWVWQRVRHGRAPSSLASFLVPWRTFTHPSSRLDLRVYLANTLLRAAFPSLAILQAAVAAITSVALQLALGRPLVTTPGPFVPAVYTLCLFLADDFTRYLVHRQMHRVPALWELHKVHHSAEVLTPLTVYRIHPLESLLLLARAALASGLVTGLFFYLYRNALSGWAVLGINVFGFGFAALGSNLRHSHVWISFGPVLERFWMSPAQHQIHHSLDPRHRDKNFGSFLSVWDAMGGSLYVTNRRERLRFGLDAADANHDRTLGSTFLGPLRAIRDRRRRRRRRS